MALRLGEIRVGSLAYFDHKLLLAEADVRHIASGLDRPGPFVCIQKEGDRSVWTPITQDHRPERLVIDPKWRRQGSDAWQKGDQYLNDGRNTFVGLNDAFVRAGAKETPFVRYKRPYITAEGVSAILAEVKARNGELLKPEAVKP